MSLLLTAILANLIPDNPYLMLEQPHFYRSNLLNFHGLTRLVSSLWPFAALTYLSALGLWRSEHLRS